MIAGVDVLASYLVEDFALLGSEFFHSSAVLQRKRLAFNAALATQVVKLLLNFGVAHGEVRRLFALGELLDAVLERLCL